MMQRSRGGPHLGRVEEVVARWGLAERLARARHFGAAYEACLACRVETSARGKLHAGKAYITDRRIVLHRELMPEGRESDRDSTFLHECAHILADLHYGKPCKHGPLWRATMVMLGELPTVHHDIPYLSRNAHAAIVWRCVTCGELYHFVRKPRRRIQDCRCSTCGQEAGRLVAEPVEPIPDPIYVK
jgi:predicted SprT family Zn-dependent metalloprotease